MKVIYHPRTIKVIRSLENKDRSRILQVVDLFIDREFELTEEHLKKLRKDLWELRAGRYRVLFGIRRSTAVIVAIFKKQTQKTPLKELELAVQRIKNYEK